MDKGIASLDHLFCQMSPISSREFEANLVQIRLA